VRGKNDGRKIRYLIKDCQCQKVKSYKIRDGVKSKIRENMKLIKEMERYLPIPVYPSKELLQLLRKQGKNIRWDTELNITKVFDSGDAGGIVCTVLEENKEVLIVSLTHLKIKPTHPLNEKIVAYQKQRVKNITGR